jgi:hypothetical protein
MPMHAMPQFPPVQQPYYTPTMSSGPLHHYAPYHQYPHLNAMGLSVLGHVAAMGPIPKVFSLSVGGWPESDRLSLERNNWIPWSTCVKLELGLQPGAVRFLGGDNPCPSFDMFPGHHRAWLDTDAIVRAFISNVCAITERECFAEEMTALAVWNNLCQRHEHRGPIRQIRALRKFVVTKYSSDPSTFSATTTELSNLNSSIWAAGPVDANSFLLAGMLTALSMHHRKFVTSMLGLPHLDLSTLKEKLVTLNAFDADEDDVVNAVQAKSRSGASQKKISCTNSVCPKPDTHESQRRHGGSHCARSG